jgi:hypothetical protein
MRQSLSKVAVDLNSNGKVMVRSCSAPQSGNRSVLVQSIGPFVSSGGFLDHTVFIHVNALLHDFVKHPEGITVTDSTFLFLDKVGSQLHAPPMVVHHGWVLNASLHQGPSLLHFQDTMGTCKLSDKGTSCMPQDVLADFGSPLTRPPIVLASLRDVRRSGSSSLEWYFQVRMEWIARNHALKTLSTFSLELPYMFASDRLVPGSSVPLVGDSFAWTAGQFFSQGTMLSGMASAHGGSMFTEAFFFLASPSELGLLRDGFVQEDASAVILPEEVKMSSNSDVKNYIFRHVRLASDSELLSPLKCHFKGNFESVDGVELPRRSDVCCSSLTFTDTDIWTFVVFFSGHRTRDLIGEVQITSNVSRIYQHAGMGLVFETADPAANVWVHVYGSSAPSHSKLHAPSIVR